MKSSFIKQNIVNVEMAFLNNFTKKKKRKRDFIQNNDYLFIFKVTF